jgi:hypothetical protein
VRFSVFEASGAEQLAYLATGDWRPGRKSKWKWLLHAITSPPCPCSTSHFPLHTPYTPAPTPTAPAPRAPRAPIQYRISNIASSKSLGAPCPLLAPLSPHQAPTDLPNTPHTSNNQLGTPLPTEVPPSCVQVRFLLPTSVLLAVSWAHFGFPEQQATYQTRPVNSPCGASSVLWCVRGVGGVCGGFRFRRKKTQKLSFWHPGTQRRPSLIV